MDRKTYIKEVYSKYWLNARERMYGFSEYDENLSTYICDHIPRGRKLLDVGIGTGYPLGDFLQKNGYYIYGIDISPELIKKCNILYPDIDAKVGDAEELEYPDNYFGGSYCFHSTWYFTNLKKAIEEMIRVTCHGCLIIFDIQNRNNQEIENAYNKNLRQAKGLGKYRKVFKNIAKMVLLQGIPDWHFVVYEVPTYPHDVYQYLKECCYPNTFQVYVRENDDSLRATQELSSFEGYGRLVFAVLKS
jgi:ubiquinone/menaquinone biosynthesis C-methylase UbiE